eukprot:tig00000204_g17748.t1
MQQQAFAAPALIVSTSVCSNVAASGASSACPAQTARVPSTPGRRHLPRTLIADGKLQRAGFDVKRTFAGSRASLRPVGPAPAVPHAPASPGQRCASASLATAPSIADLCTSTIRVREGSFEGQKQVDGKALPLVVELEGGCSASVADVRAWVQEKKAAMEALMHAHGAVLYRGFPARSPAEFDSVLSAFGYEDANIRQSVAGCVRRLLEADPEHYIWMHHENAHQPRPIRTVFFLCEEPSAEGGETSVALSTRVRERFEREWPDAYRRAVERQLMKCVVIPGQFAAGYFGESDPAAARSKAASLGYRVEEQPDGRWWVKITGPPVRPHPVTGEPVFFNHMSWDWCRFYAPNFPTNGMAYGDGEAVPKEDMEAVRNIAEEEKVPVPWQAGDILMVDNVKAMHGRNAYRGTRKNYGAFFY